MKIYKELKFIGNKNTLDNFTSKIYDYFPTWWVKSSNVKMLKEYILADYVGDKAPHAEVSIYFGEYVKNDYQITVGNIVPLEKSQLTVDEYNKILDLFYSDIILSYCSKNKDLKIEGPTSGKFEPRDYITDEALRKLTVFCAIANKSTGSAHPSDEEKWFDFVCQTVDDDRTFDYDVLYSFLVDEEYWENKGITAWSKDKADDLASEYESYVKLLRYYKQKWEC